MSSWIELKKENISFSDDGKDVHIFVHEDYFGSNYFYIKRDDLVQMLLAHQMLLNIEQDKKSAN